MESIMNWIGANILLSSIAAVICGIALFYLVMARTIKHREETSDPQSQNQ